MNYEEALEMKKKAQALIKGELKKASQKFAETSEEDAKRLTDKSIKDFAEGEGNPDPLQARQIKLPKPKHK